VAVDPRAGLDITDNLAGVQVTKERHPRGGWTVPKPEVRASDLLTYRGTPGIR
jgi:hypothetical protein